MKVVTRKRSTAEFKAQAVGLVGLGKPVAVVAEKPAADELPRLWRENGNLKLENDISKKAAIILGTKTLPGAVR